MTQTKAELLQTRHQGDIRLGDANSSHYVGFKAPATVGTSLVWTLPAVDGTANYLLKTDGSGNLGWVADSTTDSTKMPLAGGTFNGDVTFSGANYNLVWDKSDDALEFADNTKAVFGQPGNDLTIRHDGSNSYIHHDGAGSLVVKTTGTGEDVYIQAGNDIYIQPQTSEEGIKVIGNGAVELYHDNVKKFETTSTGVDIPDTLRLSDSFADIGTQMCLGADSNGVGYIASHTIKFNTGSNNSRSTTATLDSSGRVLIGETTAITTSSNRLLQVVGDTNGGGVIALGRNDTTLTNESLGGIEFYGNDPGSAFTRAASIMCEAAAEWTSNDYPTKLIFKTTPDGSATNTLALTLDSSQNATFAGQVSVASELHIDGTYPVIELNDTDSNSDWQIRNANGEFALRDITNNANRFTITSAGTAEFPSSSGTVSISAGTVSDSIGELRQIPSRSVSSVTLAASDVGKAILATSTVTVPNGTFSAGDAVTIINNSGGDITISKSISTMYLASDGTSANRTLATRGMATIWFASGTVAYISGAGLS